jgi:hypothetical protein
MNHSKIKNYYRYIFASFLGVFILLFFLVLNHEIYLPIGRNISDYSSDGIKNLYTFAYYLKYDTGIHFTGLFYPFNELVIYMDAQPFWVWVIKGLESVFHFHIENPIIYIHLILLFNLWLCSFFTFLILYHFNKNYFFTVLGTFIIILLSPQIFRFASHYALGNMGIIPMFWWWYIQLANRHKILPHILFTIALILVGFIHPYLLLMLIFLFMSFEMISFLITKKMNWLKISSSTIALVLFQISLKFFDNINDRPTRAWGAKEFSCRIDDLLLPLNGWLKVFFLKFFPNIPTSYTEGHGYVTIFGLFVLIVLITKGFLSVFRRKWKLNIQLGSTEQWVLAAIPVLMFAFFIPFRWHMDWLINIITPLKQFRGTGRFVVVFYYVYLVFVFVYLEKLYQRSPKIISLVLILGTIISVSDLLNNSKKQLEDFHSFGKYDAYNTFKAKSEDLFSKVENIEDYQCIIPYPPSTEGTEIMWLDADWNAKINYLWFSYFNHLPLATVHSSRASFSENMEIVQLSGYFTSPKPILNKFNPNKKCLVIAEDKHQYENIPLIKNAKWINTVDNLALYSIEIQDLKSTSTQERKNDWIDSSSYSLIGENHFEKEKNGQLLLTDQKKHKKILTVSVLDDKRDKNLRVLFWYQPKYQKEPSIPIIEAYKMIDQKEVFIHDWREQHTQTYNYRDGWFCVDYTLKIDNETTNVIFKIYSEDIVVDDFSVYLQK